MLTITVHQIIISTILIGSVSSSIVLKMSLKRCRFINFYVYFYSLFSYGNIIFATLF